MTERTLVRPPIDRRLVVKRLERAQTEHLSVHVFRWIPRCDEVDGFVVGIGRRWVAVAAVDYQSKLDGYTLVRLKDIQAVEIDPDPECFEVRALRARDSWPLPGIDAELDDTAGAMRTAIAGGTLVSVYAEEFYPNTFWLGVASFTKKRAVRLMKIGRKGLWAKRPITIRLKGLTRIDFGDTYAKMYGLVAGVTQ